VEDIVTVELHLVLSELIGLDLQGDGFGGVSLGIPRPHHFANDRLEVRFRLQVFLIRVAIQDLLRGGPKVPPRV
jgi:hypothetical protein